MNKILIKRGFLITLDSNNNKYEGDILIENGRISDIAPRIDVEADKIINADGKLVLPGFIHGHLHLCQTLFKRIFGQSNDDTSLMDALDKITYYESKHTPETLYASARLGLVELIKSGTTGIIDMGTLHYQDSVFQAIEESGIRAQAGKAMMDRKENLPPYLQENTQDSMRESVDLLQRWHGKGNGRIRYGFCPRWQLWNTEGLLIEVKQEADRHGAGIHGHAGEGRDEANLMLKQTGKRNLTFLSDIGVIGPNVQMAHCIWLDEQEMQVLKDTGTHPIHCPSSNSWGSGIARVPEMLDRGISVALGSDGAVTGNLNMFVEMRTAFYIHQNRLIDQVSGAWLAPEKILNMATKGGASALGETENLGSLEKGKKADMIILDDGDCCAGPWLSYEKDDPISRIVCWYQSQSVQTVIADGQIIMEDRVILTMNEEDVKREARNAINEIMESTM
jgi:5-methylthioadenosine/S-adenosylhomocysteine deaminase